MPHLARVGVIVAGFSRLLTIIDVIDVIDA